jgi:HlyD family secretion protein
MSRNRIIAILFIVLLFGGLYGMARVRGVRKVTKSTAQIHQELGTPVRTAAVQLGSIEDTVPVTGSLAALESVTLSSKIPGKVVYVTVREGDRVNAGDVVVQLDRSDGEANLRQALAGLESAQARLSQARTSAAVTEVQSSAAIQQARAALAGAEANLEKVRTGARSQERMIAENAVATAKANLDNAQANLRRTKQLFDQGAIAAAQLDVAQTQYDVAKAQYDSAKENLSLVEEGARSEDVRAAETQVTQAREALRTAQANAGQNALRREDIKNAVAGVSQAEAQVALAREQLANTTIRSSITGYVSKRMTEPGQTASPAVPLMEVVNVRTVFFQADVSETVLAKIEPGQVVRVKVDACPDATFTGRVAKIYPTASVGTRNFSVRVHIPNQESRLRPGMFARGSVVTGGNDNALLVPQDAVEERAGRYVVFTLEGKTAKMHTINKGLSNPEFVEALPPTDIGVGDVVITAGHEYLEDGKKVDKRG